MQGISDARLRTGKAAVLANPLLYTDFETVVNFLTTLLNEEESMSIATRSHQRNVSVMRTTPNNRNESRAPRGGGRGGRSTGGRGRGGRTGRGGRHNAGRYNTSNVTDRSYTKEEWLALSYEDRQKVRDLHSKRNREMNASVATIDRNVSQRYNDVTDKSISDTNSSRSMAVSGITSTSSSTNDSSGIGSNMSQRTRNRNTL
jgi:hypothetical protein